MKDDRYSVSVIIPVYNGEFFIEDAVESILSQNYQPLEIIVVDDGSTDRTAEIISKIPGNIRCLKQENYGPASARNKGILSAGGELIAFLDADDLWSSQKLELQIKALEKDRSLEMVLGQIQCLKWVICKDQKEKYLPFDKPFFTFLFGAGLFRKAVFDSIGLLDESLRYSEDVDWYLKAKEKASSIKILDEIVLYYRFHDKNMVLKKKLRNSGLLLSLKKAIDRKRKCKQV